MIVPVVTVIINICFDYAVSIIKHALIHFNITKLLNMTLEIKMER
jgi:hypothetical protein